MPAQFDLCRLTGGALVLVLQDDLHEGLASRVVAPVVPVRSVGPQPPRLCPVVDVGERPHVVLCQSLAAIPIGQLRTRIGTLAPRKDEIVRALDLLFTGI